MSSAAVDRLTSHLALGSLLEALGHDHRGYDLVAHWKQGEFHHDVVLRVHQQARWSWWPPTATAA